MAKGMTERFDPYYRWLAIPQNEQPPNHYRLLGLPLFESNGDVIDSAADRQAAHVRSHMAGPHAAESQKLLNEVAKARVCLLNPVTRAAYDRQLRASLAPVAPPPVAPAPPPLKPIVSRSARHPLLGPAIAGAITLCAATAVFLLGAVYPALDLFGVFRAKSTERTADAVAEPTETNVEDPQVAIESQQEQSPSAPAREPTEPVASAPADEAPASNIADGSTDPEKVAEAPPSPQNKVVPDAAVLEHAATALRAAIESESPDQLFQRSQAGNVAPAERFVFLQAARDKAAAAVDVGVALRASAELAKQFDLDPVSEKLDAILALDDALKTSETVAPADSRDLAEAALTLIKELSARGEHDEAAQCVDAALRAARRSEDASLIGRATLAAIEVRQPQ
jgi:hypothetical protein